MVWICHQLKDINYVALLWDSMAGRIFKKSHRVSISITMKGIISSLTFGLSPNSYLNGSSQLENLHPRHCRNLFIHWVIANQASTSTWKAYITEGRSSHLYQTLLNNLLLLINFVFILIMCRVHYQSEIVNLYIWAKFNYRKRCLVWFHFLAVSFM